jgi:hypothetical protein
VSCGLNKLKFKISLCAITFLTLVGLYPSQAFLESQFIQEKLADGVVLRLHLSKDMDKQRYDYAQDVLQAACAAYREIVFRQGFDRLGYTFASPTNIFAYDSDRTIDIYMEDIDSPYASMTAKDGLEYEAGIYVPIDFKAYRKKYKIDYPQLELKASLTHELLHIVIHAYNRNMQSTLQGKALISAKQWDWYTEGLARYFETLVGYRKAFLSSGFRKKLGKKLMVYKGGVNYFLKYPDRPLSKRKYDFALFWQYLHQNYGMDKIEKISVRFRKVDPLLCSHKQSMQIIAQTVGVSLEELWRDFALYVYKISSLQDEGEGGLRPVYITELSSRKGENYDNICSFGLDYYKIDLQKKSFKSIQISVPEKLNCVAAVSFAQNFLLIPIDETPSGKKIINTADLPDHSQLIIMLSNPTDKLISYQLTLD